MPFWLKAKLAVVPCPLIFLRPCIAPGATRRTRIALALSPAYLHRTEGRGGYADDGSAFKKKKNVYLASPGTGGWAPASPAFPPAQSLWLRPPKKKKKKNDEVVGLYSQAKLCDVWDRVMGGVLVSLGFLEIAMTALSSVRRWTAFQA